MRSHRVSFEGERGRTYAARLELPVDDAPVAYAVFAHLFACAEDPPPADWIVEPLHRSGLAVLILGLPQEADRRSDGEVGSEDVLAACAYLAREHRAPALLVGHSLAGAAALLAASELAGLEAVATVAAPASAQRLATLRQGEAEGDGRAVYKLRLGERDVTLSPSTWAGLQREAFEGTLASLRTPALVLHSPADNVVGVDSARAIFEVLKHPKSFVSLHSADHFLTREEDARYAGEVIAGWARRYVERERVPSWKDDIRDNRIMVRTEDSLRTEGMANGFGLVVDEPAEVGGTDSGPSPYDYLAAALGACTSMTLRMYADRKGWPLEAVSVEVRHDKVHAEDCEHCDERSARLDRFRRFVRLEGKLDAVQRARLLEIANRCPVHRTLASEVRIETTLQE